MEILVFEYITGGGLRHETLPASLAREGDMMLRALVTDLLDIPRTRLTVLRDDRLPMDYLPERVTRVPVAAADDFGRLWKHCIENCDAVWPIAPETGGVLERLCRDAERANKALLTSPPAAVAIASSKLETVRTLERGKLPAIPTLPLEDWRLSPTYPSVVKPDDGAGCEGARIVRAGLGFIPNTGTCRWVAQPLLEGDALSLSALFAYGHTRLLSCNRQHIGRSENSFTLKGCTVNAASDTDGTWQALTDNVARALPELWGYAGVDLILTEQGPRILEINPRLTTSYAGLREAIGENPAAMVLDLHETGRLPPPRTNPGKAVMLSWDRPDEH